MKISEAEEQQSATTEALLKEQRRHGKVMQSLAINFFELDTDIRELKQAR